MTPFLSAIFPFGFNFAPQGWAFCSGQLLAISQNTALFALLGTNFGGNGQTTFGLPDLRGRAPVHFGQGAGLPIIQLGEISGSENATIALNQFPQHSHNVFVSNGQGSISSPLAGNSLAALTDINGDIANFYGTAAVTTQLNNATVGLTGGTQPHNNMQPFLAMNYCIALEGIFPSRN